ncbi:MAG TPA: hypothetical protein VG649_02580 [Candidatus Angelobacter sp.]|nr:hypothetical protein [Candidatus Angelobacter sp.]
MSPEPEVATRQSEFTPAAGVHPKESAQVARFIANGDSSSAVEAAKKIHKRSKSAASEALLVDAYIARIAALIGRNLEAEARNLMERIRGLYPSARARLPEIKALFGVRKGALDAILSPLNDPLLTEDRRAAIYKIIACQVSDLDVLAECQVLAAEHPLRKTARDLLTALKAVTSGPVDDQALAFPEISRHSPFASWKMLLRAIAAFYRQDKELCERCLTAIDPQTAPALLAPALRAMLGQKQTLTPASDLLVKQAGGSFETLRPRLQKLDQLFERRNMAQAVREIREVIGTCRGNCPVILERLKQHISVRALIAGLQPDKLQSALQGEVVLRDAYFWRLLARSSEDPMLHPNALLVACSFWEEFRRHAVREALLPAAGPEVATLYLHMADLVDRIPEEERSSLRNQFVIRFDGHEQFYRNQSAEIRGVMLPRGKIDTYFMFPEKLLERACQVDPCVENFQRWFDWTTRNYPAISEYVARRWSAAFPKDVRPLLHLMDHAEKTNSLQKAFDFMQQAEFLDGLNPQVRKARLRLLVSIAVRHFQKKKARLSELDLEALEVLPQIEQGDRKAFVAALRWVSSMLWGSQAERETRSANVAKLLNSEVAAQVVLRGVARACKLPGNVVAPIAFPPATKLVPGIARACALGADMGFQFEIPDIAYARLMQELSSSDLPANLPGLAAMGEAALRAENWILAYTVAGAGLAGNPTGHAGFLFIRAVSLPPWEVRRHDACLAAASELARRQRDHGLLDKIGQWRDSELDGIAPLDAGLSMSSEQVNKVIEQETEQREYPKSNPQPSLPDDDDGYCDCPKCRRERAGMPPGFEALEAMLDDMVDEFGSKNIEAALNEIFAGPSKQKKKKRRRGPWESDRDIPF